MTVLQVQSLPVLAHQHRTITFFAFLWSYKLIGMNLIGWSFKVCFCP